MNAVVDWLDRRAAEGPVTVLFDDLQWADASSIELLDRLLARARPGFTIIATSRSAYSGAGALSGSGRPGSVVRRRRPAVGCSRSPLSKPSCGRGAKKGRRQPVFAIELARAAAGGGRPGQITSAQAAGPYAILSERLASAGQNKHLLQVSAVLGREVPADLLGFLTAIPPRILETRLDQLVALHLLRRVDDRKYAFAHDLLRDVALESLPEPARRAIEHSVALSMSDRFADRGEAQPEAVARHFARGGDGPRARAWWKRAGLSAIGSSAHSEAIAHLKEAIAIGDPGANRVHDAELAELYTTLAIPCP